MNLIFMNREKACTRIIADEETKTVTIQNYDVAIQHRAFGIKESPTWEDYQRFLESRCVSRNMAHLDLYLKKIGVSHYDPILII